MDPSEMDEVTAVLAKDELEEIWTLPDRSASDFRRRLKQSRIAGEKTLGASIRRLRQQKRMTRNDFGEVDPKTLARIEQGKVTTPREDTLAAIARELGVERDELGEY